MTPPAAETFAPEVVLWTDAQHAPMLRKSLDIMAGRVRTTCVGGQRVGEVEALANQLAAPFTDDLRHALIDQPPAFVILASNLLDDPAPLLDAMRTGACILALEPLLAEFDDLASLRGRAAGGPLRGSLAPLPSFVHAPGWQRAADPAAAVGQLRVIRFTAFGPPDACSLFARLHDAWAAVLDLVDPPTTVDASLIGPTASTTTSLRAAAGALLVHGRLADGGAMVIAVGDHAAPQRRRMHLLGDEGEFIIDDGAYQLFDARRQLVDQHQPDPPLPDDWPDLVAEQWDQLIERGRPGPPSMEVLAHRQARILACCHACLLSARTKSPESPARFLQIHGWTR